MNTELDVRGSSQIATNEKCWTQEVGKLYKYYSHYCQHFRAMLMSKSIN
jgi:hypothetical protein